MDMNTALRPPLELRHVDPARRRARRYHIAESASLFGELGLIISWGRIGRPARTRFESFATENELATRYQELLARRKAHGYQVQMTGV
jgi:predicted DNA-binding WGR domain protein